MVKNRNKEIKIVILPNDMIMYEEIHKNLQVNYYSK